MFKRNILVIFITLLLISFHIYITSNGFIKYKNLLVSEEKWNEIIESREEVLDSMINSLSFNNVNLFKDNDGIFYYSLIDNSNTAYAPKLYYDTMNDVNIMIKSLITDDMISNNEYLEILFYNDEFYKIEKVVCTKLPVMSLNFYVDVLNRDEYVSMDMALYDNRSDAVNRLITSTGEIRYRGATSYSYPKKSYRMKLNIDSLGDNSRNNNTALLGMRKNNSWLLTALYSDPEKVRNVFSSNLWYDCCSKNNSFDISNGIEYKYIELIVNGEYQGLYALGYPLDEKQMELSKNSFGYYDEYLFKKQGWLPSEYDISRTKDKGLDSYFIISSYNDESDAWLSLLRIYHRLNVEPIKEELEKSFDMDNFIDLYLYFNFVQGIDNINDVTINNAYVTLKKYNNDYKLILTPWDMDQTFGNIWNMSYPNNINSYGIKTDNNFVMKFGPVAKLLEVDDIDIKNRINERYEELRNTIWSEEYILDLINEYEGDIYNSGVFLREKNTWPDGNYNLESEKLSVFKDYVLERITYMDEYMKDNFEY